MPLQLLPGALRLDYDSAIKADITKQEPDISPRYWYIDATIPCDRCRSDFLFSAGEQKAWYEDYRFYVWSFPKQCQPCRRELRHLKALRQEYDREIAGALRSADVDLKTRIATVIDELCEAGIALPDKALDKRSILAKQIARSINMS